MANYRKYKIEKILNMRYREPKKYKIQNKKPSEYRQLSYRISQQQHKLQTFTYKRQRQNTKYRRRKTQKK